MSSVVLPLSLASAVFVLIGVSRNFREGLPWCLFGMAMAVISTVIIIRS